MEYISSSKIDLIIIGAYLLITLVVGIYKGRGVTTVREFAVSDKTYTTPIIVATIFTTLLGDGSTMGLTARFFILGLVFVQLAFGEPMIKIFISELIGPRMGRFREMISAGDMMGSFYGKSGKLITGIAGLVVCVGYLGVQVKAFGIFFHYFTSINAEAAMIVGAGIVIAYSTFGGIKSVTATDVVQFAVIVVAVPIIANVALMEVGGVQALLASFPKEKIEVFPESLSKWQMIVLGGLYCVPFFNPALIQRLLMARDTKQMITSMRVAALLDIPFYATIGVIILCAYVLSPSVDASEALPYLINTYMPVGVKGVAIAGMLAVIMSTADSYLHAASVSLVHDVIKPVCGASLSNEKELKLTRWFTILIGLLSIVAALSFGTIMELLLLFLNVWGPVVVIPLIAGIFGYKASTKTFLFSVLASVITFLAWRKLIPDLEPTIPSMIVNAATFFILSRFDRERQLGVKKKSVGPLLGKV